MVGKEGEPAQFDPGFGDSVILRRHRSEKNGKGILNYLSDSLPRVCKKKKIFLSATAGTTIGTDETAFLVYEGLLTAVRTNLSLGSSTIHHILLQGTLNTDLPGIDALAIELQ
jgi:hypothetical protein